MNHENFKDPIIVRVFIGKSAVIKISWNCCQKYGINGKSHFDQLAIASSSTPLQEMMFNKDTKRGDNQSSWKTRGMENVHWYLIPALMEISLGRHSTL